MNNWHAIYVKSRTEKKVVDLLINNSIDAYLPILKTMRQWSDRKKMIEMPLFNGYVFVNINPKQKDDVLHTNGVVGFVKHCGQMAVVRDIEIQQLKQLIDLGYIVDANQIKQKITTGDKIKITSGLLKNLEGYVLNDSNGKYMEVVLETIGQSIKVKLPQELLMQL